MPTLAGTDRPKDKYLVANCWYSIVVCGMQYDREAYLRMYLGMFINKTSSTKVSSHAIHCLKRISSIEPVSQSRDIGFCLNKTLRESTVTPILTYIIERTDLYRGSGDGDTPKNMGYKRLSRLRPITLVYNDTNLRAKSPKCDNSNVRKITTAGLNNAIELSA